MFAARLGTAVPSGQVAGAEQVEEHPGAHHQPAVPHREARLVPGRVRAALRRGSEAGHGSNTNT